MTSLEQEENYSYYWINSVKYKAYKGINKVLYIVLTNSRRSLGVSAKFKILQAFRGF